MKLSEEIDDSKIAYLAYSLPGSNSYQCFKSAYTKGILTEDRLKHYNFVMAPFSRDEHPVYWFKYLEPLAQLHDIEWSYGEAPRICIDKPSYLQTARNIVDLLQDDVISKLVYSRIKSKGRGDLDPWLLFIKLVKNYLDAFCFLIYIPDHMLWMGASPEILLSQSGQDYKTVALAGTQLKTDDIDSVQWGKKEIEEHAFIETYLEQVFTSLYIEFSKSKKYTAAAARVCHIKSEFNFKSSVPVSSVLEKIHPGPALSGFPVTAALKSLSDYELHDRSYYTGFLGPVGNQLELYVNLRSMEIDMHYCYLYVGGGYTKDSDPHSEWEETEMKAATLLDLIDFSTHKKMA